MKTVAIMGATGLIGQQFIRLLSDHPKFELSYLYASERSSGMRVSEFWDLPYFDCPSTVQEMKIDSMKEISPDVDVVFSALPSKVAQTIEADLRAEGMAVFSNASVHRMDDDVPILIPEINAEQAQLVDIQRDNYSTDGFIICNSNCSAAGSAIYLHELDRLVEFDKVVITTYQALSGAGINGVPSLKSTNNVIPFIPGEEPKIIEETRKMIGRFTGTEVHPHPSDMVANAARVNVVDGHLEAITVFGSDFSKDDVEPIKNVNSRLDTNAYHIAPKTHLQYLHQDDRPQQVKDVLSGYPSAAAGMTVSVGRLRINQTSISSYVLVHNTIRGGAGGSVLNAEYMLNEGYI